MGKDRLIGEMQVYRLVTGQNPGHMIDMPLADSRTRLTYKTASRISNVCRSNF